MVRTPQGSQKPPPMYKDPRNEDDDDDKMNAYGSKHGKGVRRSGKSSRQKWNNEKKTDPRHKSFTPPEEELVIKLHAAIGSRWPIIAQQLPGRTENDVKILWNSKLRKKLCAMGIDPVTHRPFSQILADYGNIGAFPKARTRFRDLKNAVLLPEQSQMYLQTSPKPENNFPGGNVSKIQFPDSSSSLDLYSQLQAINMVTEASNYNKTESAATPYFTSSLESINQEMSSFAWSDFLLEDAFMPPNVEEQDNAGTLMQCEGIINEEKQSYGDFEDKNSDAFATNSYEASSSSNSSFVEALMERQDDLFPEFPDLYGEPFYY